MNARTSLERQWAGLIVRQPAARFVLTKWLRSYGIEPHWLHFDDPHAALIIQAVIELRAMHGQPVTVESVAQFVGERDFTLTTDEAARFVRELVDNVADDVDVERMALSVLDSMHITFPEHEVNEYLTDPYGLRAERMKARKVKAWR